MRFCETGPSPDAAFKIAQTGIYSIDLDLEAMTMKLERKQLYVFGNATDTDWNQNNWNHLPLEYGDNNHRLMDWKSETRRIPFQPFKKLVAGTYHL